MVVSAVGWLDGWIPFLRLVTMDARALARRQSCIIPFHQGQDGTLFDPGEVL